MNAQLSTYPWPVSAFAYTVLAAGWVAVVWFMIRYMSTAPWHRSDVGRHLVAFTACVGGFFTLYLALGIWPNMPAAGPLRIVLLVGIVAVSIWRAVLFETYRRRDLRGRE